MLALRPAMNAPVLNVNFLPVGPARSAIVAFAEEYGGIGMALGIRTNEGGHVAVIRNQESVDFDTPISQALEPLLAEAERMGFLFDEDMVAIMAGDQGRAHAMGLWARLMGEVEMPPAPRAVPAQPAANEPILELSDAKVLVDNPANLEFPELDLDDLADFDETEIGADDDILELDLPMEAALPPALAAPEAPEVPAAPAAPQQEAKPVPVAARTEDRSAPENVPPARAPAAPPPVRRATDAKPTPPVAPRTERRAVAQKSALPVRETVQPAAASALLPSAKVKPAAEVSTQAPEQTLSKFRNADQVAAQAAALPQSMPAKSEGEGGNELGRIPLVRVRRERDGSKRVPYLARLLSSF